MLEKDWVEVYKNGGDTQAVNQRINEITIERGYVSYTLTYKEYDFINNRTLLLELIKYDKKGNVLESNSFNNIGNTKVDSDWMNIVPGSVGETIFNALRKKFYK